MSTERPLVGVDSAQQWQSWLDAHHATSGGIWLMTWKKGAAPTWATMRSSTLP